MTAQQTQWIIDGAILWLICIRFFNLHIELSKLNHMFSQLTLFISHLVNL